jgi:hypothetical protein
MFGKIISHRKSQRIPSEPRAIAQVFDELAREYEHGWVTFESDGSSRVVEVADDESHFTLNVPHSEARGLLPTLESKGIRLPTSWDVRRDKKKRLFGNGFLDVKVPKSSGADLAAFVIQLGRQCLDWPEGAAMTASIQK